MLKSKSVLFTALVLATQFAAAGVIVDQHLAGGLIIDRHGRNV